MGHWSLLLCCAAVDPVCGRCISHGLLSVYEIKYLSPGATVLVSQIQDDPDRGELTMCIVPVINISKDTLFCFLADVKSYARPNIFFARLSRELPLFDIPVSLIYTSDHIVA